MNLNVRYKRQSRLKRAIRRSDSKIQIRVTVGAFELKCQRLRARQAATPPFRLGARMYEHVATNMLSCAAKYSHAVHYGLYIAFKICVGQSRHGRRIQTVTQPLSPDPCQVYFIEVALLDSGMVGPDLSHAPA